MGDANTEQEWPYLCILKLLEKESNRDFEKLRELCQEISEDMPDMEISTDIKYTIDEEAKPELGALLKKLEREDLANLSPKDVVGDGSCLFRALSFLCFGHQNRHRELRLRCIIEMATNKDRYLEYGKLLERSITNYILNKYNATTSGTSKSDGPASGTQNDSGHIANGSHDDGDSSTDDGIFEANFTSDVIDTCNPNAFATYWHILALAVILKRKIKIVCVSKNETKELKELREHLDRPIEPQDLGVSLEPGEDDPPLTIMWNLDSEHFVPLIPAGAIKEEVDSGLGKSLESDTTNVETHVVGEPRCTSTPKKAVKVEASVGEPNEKTEQDEDSDDHDNEVLDITSGDVKHILSKLEKLLECDIKLKNKKLSKETLNSLTGPYQIADPKIVGILKKSSVKLFVARLIEVQFQIKWHTDDGRPERFNFYEFCDVEKYDNKGKGKTAHLKYDPRRAHVFTELYREATRETMTRNQRDEAFSAGKDKKVFCPDVYVKVNKHGWVKICFASKECERVDDFKKRFSWMHESLREFIANNTEEITLPADSKLDYSSVTAAIRKRTLYWAVLKDTDFKSGKHLKLHEIGKTQVYVGKADGGIQNRWIKNANSHSEQMMKCFQNICKMRKSFDVSRLDGIQLVDARLLLAKIRKEKRALFLIQTFQNKKDLLKAEERHRIGKQIGKKNVNIVPSKVVKDWSPKKMAFGMNNK